MEVFLAILFIASLLGGLLVSSKQEWMLTVGYGAFLLLMLFVFMLMWWANHGEPEVLSPAFADVFSKHLLAVITGLLFGVAIDKLYGSHQTC